MIRCASLNKIHVVGGNKEKKKKERTGPKNGYLFLISKEELCRLDSKEHISAFLNSLQQQPGFKSILQVCV